MFQFFKDNNLDVVEKKYFEKYKNFLNQENVLNLLEEYKKGPTMFEPLRNKLTRKEQENLYTEIDESIKISPREKFEVILSTMMILDGIFPSSITISQIEMVMGKEFMDLIRRKQEEFKLEND